MKKLDEVIFEAPYSQTPWEADALHYLKEYKQTRQDLLDGMKRLEGKELMFIHALANLEDNPPMTWDELKQMEGKPVWMEYRRSVRNRWGHRCWHIIKNIQRVRFDRTDTEWLRVDEDGVYFDKADLGKTWQAFRKERE